MANEIYSNKPETRERKERERKARERKEKGEEYVKMKTWVMAEESSRWDCSTCKGTMLSRGPTRTDWFGRKRRGSIQERIDDSDWPVCIGASAELLKPEVYEWLPPGSVTEKCGDAVPQKSPPSFLYGRVSDGS